MRKFRSDSDGDYKYRNDAKTFSDEFYFINFIDKYDKYNSKFSEKLFEKKYALNRAKWISENKWYLKSKNIDYLVYKIGVYSSNNGHIESFKV
jgi:predicted small secreted protein